MCSQEACHPDKSLAAPQFRLLRHVEPLCQEPAYEPPIDQVQCTAMDFEAASKWLQSTLQRNIVGSVEIEAYSSCWGKLEPSAKTGASAQEDIWLQGYQELRA